MELKLSTKNLFELKTMLAAYPKQAKYAIRNSLNDFAKDIRTMTLKEKNAKLTYRNKTLARKSITYVRAELAEIPRMMSVIGSSPIETRFTGFGEQEGVVRTKRKRFPTKKGRTRKRVTIPREYRADNDMPVLDRLIGKKNIRTARNALAYMNRMNSYTFNVLGKTYQRSTFMTLNDIEFKGRTIKKGVHRFGYPKPSRYSTVYKKIRTNPEYMRHQIETLQVEPEREKLQPHENHWLRNTTAKYFNSKEPQKHIERNLTKQVELIRKWGK